MLDAVDQFYLRACHELAGDREGFSGALGFNAVRGYASALELTLDETLELNAVLGKALAVLAEWHEQRSKKK